MSKKQTLTELIARDIIRREGYGITHLEGGGAQTLYCLARNIVREKVEKLSHETLGCIVGSHTVHHGDLHKCETSLIDVHCYQFNPSFDNDEGGLFQLKKLAMIVIVAKMTDIIAEDQEKAIRLHLDSH